MPDPDRWSRRTMLAGGTLLIGAAAAPGIPEIAPGIFVRRGIDAEATATNRDAIGNAGFVVGRDAVLVTDAGGSLADGQWLRAQIRRRTDKRIAHVVISHAHPDHLFGASAFLPDAPALIGHHRLAATIAARGDYYAGRLAAILGADAVGALVRPTVVVRAPLTIDLGGRALHLTAHPTAHSSCDLSIRDARTGILFLADLLSVERVPALDGSLLGWIAVLDAVIAGDATQAVPGHGPTLVALRPAVARLMRYLLALRDGTRVAIRAGLSIGAAILVVAAHERPYWRLFDDDHGRNVTMAYQELEWE